MSEHDKYLDIFFQPKNYIPQNEQEKKEFDEFSLVTSSMALLLYIASADNVIKIEEREQIIAARLKISKEELMRIEQEAKEDMIYRIQSGNSGV
ncbi:MAG: hypothetical protein Q7J16_05470 [Candidatus Cloacimonadales bacterium]|nr:hypothetical protein [Candidatus Cloacimonadales bacterium]